MDTRTILRKRRSEILAIAREHGAHSVRVFGSVARGEDTEHSDIDLLVAFAPGRSLLDHASLQLALTELLGRPVEIASERGLRPRYREHVLSEAVSL